MKIVSRSEARGEGATQYFTGVPCVRGHVTTRNVKSGTCHRCACDRMLVWQKENPGRVAATFQRWMDRNPGKIAEQSKKWYENNKERAADTRDAYLAARPGMRAYLSSRARADQYLRTPKWLDAADFRMIRHAYTVAKEKTRDTGVVHHVDHIIPLRAKNVSGLHTWTNLQVIPATENQTKWAKFAPYVVYAE